MRIGSVHRSRFSTRCPGRPAGPRRARKCEGRGRPPHRDWMQVTFGGPRKKQPPLYTVCLKFAKNGLHLRRNLAISRRKLCCHRWKEFSRISQISCADLPIRTTACHHERYVAGAHLPIDRRPNNGRWMKADGRRPRRARPPRSPAGVGPTGRSDAAPPGRTLRARNRFVPSVLPGGASPVGAGRCVRAGPAAVEPGSPTVASPAARVSWPHPAIDRRTASRFH
jgi:hypothetical protein